MRTRSRSDTDELIKLGILDAWDWACAIPDCGRPTETLHEIKSRGSGGKVEWGNSIPLCYHCHEKAHREVISEAELAAILRAGPP